MAIIGTIRKKAGVLVVAIIALAILAFIFTDLFSNRDPRPTKVASVNGMDISFQEFEAMTTNIEENLKQQYNVASLTNEQSFEAKRQAYQTLVTEKLLQQECQSIGLSVSEAEMNDMFFGTFIHPMIRQNFADPTTGQYNPQVVKQYIAQFDKLPEEQKIQWANFENSVKESRLQEKYNSLIVSSFYMPTKIAEHISNVSNKVVDARYVVMPFSSVEDNTVKVTEEDYKKYYNEHKNEYTLYENLRDIEFIKFTVLPSPSDIKAINDSVQKTFIDFQALEESEIASFVSISSDRVYDSLYYKKDALKGVFADSLLAGKTIGSFIAPFQQGQNWIMAKITDIEQRPDSVRFSQILVLNSNASKDIKRTPEQAKAVTDSLLNVFKANPSAFESAVAKHSDDPEAKNNFGDSGWILDGQLQSDLFDKLKAGKEGDVFVHDLPNQLGHYLIKLKEKTAPVEKLQVAMIVMGVRASDNTVNAIRDKANIFLGSAKTLKEMQAQAQKQNLNILTSTVREMDYQLNGTPYCREIVRWAFDEKTELNAVAPEVYELSDMFLVVALKDKKEKGIMTLEQVKPYIESQVKIEKKAEMLMDKADKLLASNKTIETFASAANLTIDSAMAVDFASPYFAAAGPEMRVIGSLSSASKTGIQKPVKGFNGIYVLNVDRQYTRPTKEDPKLIQQQFKTKSYQKAQMLMNVLQMEADIKNHFTFFY
ncbi:MAG: SurA N-terminal domain-containing protein [Bacteroidales bacterium]|nr:SurA N-terminal domain-containing protein [Bacteroidales bacterium]